MFSCKLSFVIPHVFDLFIISLSSELDLDTLIRFLKATKYLFARQDNYRGENPGLQCYADRYIFNYNIRTLSEYMKFICKNFRNRYKIEPL